jgi:hypothetical protein
VYACAQPKIESQLADYLGNLKDVSGNTLILPEVLDRCLYVVRDNYPSKLVIMDSNSSEDTLDIFIEGGWNNTGDDAALFARRPNSFEGMSVLDEPSSSFMNRSLPPAQLSRKDSSRGSFASLKHVSSEATRGRVTPTSLANQSPSTRSLASHMSMDSLRRRAVIESHIQDVDDDDDAASIVSSISSPRQHVQKNRKQKSRLVCICGAARARRKPSSYRQYNDQGICIVQKPQDFVDADEFDSDLKDLDSCTQDDQPEEEVSAKKSSSFWGFFKL